MRKENRKLRARLARRDDLVRALSAQLAAASAELASKSALAAAPPAVSANETRTRCVVLVVFAVISFRAVPRILALMASWSVGGMQWIPHFTSVINWTLRVGLALLTLRGSADCRPVGGDH